MQPSRVKTRIKWFLLGFVSCLTLIAAMGAVVIAAMPDELKYRQVQPTSDPIPSKNYALQPMIDMPPCVEGWKDCVPFPKTPVHAVPEPGTLALICAAGLVAIVSRRASI